MAILIGTDEAGYGPNLGPLVVAQSVWQVPDNQTDVDLYDRLRGLVTKSAEPGRASIVIADSKQLYKPRGTLARLELAVLTALGALRRSVTTWRELLTATVPDVGHDLDDIPWYRDFDCRLPTEASIQSPVEDFVSAWQTLHETGDIRLLDVRAAMVFPRTFNHRVAQLRSKGALLSETTLQSVARSIGQHDLPGPIRVVCDKHGGRNAYAALVQPHFGDGLVRVVCEGRSLSRYQLGSADRPIDISFQTKGESFLPCALASMLAKYLRELSMTAFNQFWKSQLPDLRPTAGYPVDALRFRQEIAAVQRELGIDDNQLWRCC